MRVEAMSLLHEACSFTFRAPGTAQMAYYCVGAKTTGLKPGAGRFVVGDGALSCSSEGLSEWQIGATGRMGGMATGWRLEEQETQGSRGSGGEGARQVRGQSQSGNRGATGGARGCGKSPTCGRGGSCSQKTNAGEPQRQRR